MSNEQEIYWDLDKLADHIAGECKKLIDGMETRTKRNPDIADLKVVIRRVLEHYAA